MKKAILATKVGMTQIFDENGVLVPVTVLQAGPCVVTQVKTADNDGYSAIQVGFGEKKENRVNKPMKGQFAKDSRVPSRDMVSPEDLWLMVPNIIVTQVPMVLAPIRVRYSKEKECQDRWVERKSPYRTWKS